MTYSYEAERAYLFTEDGQVKFLEVRDAVHALLKTAGAFRLDCLSVTGDSFLFLACIDRLVELGEIVPLRAKGTCWGQYQVYATPQVHNR
jgi:hypothetical protein